MFCEPKRVGHFAVDPNQLAAGEDNALFRLLVTMIMFQRRSDAQIMRVLKGISSENATELTSAERLLQLSQRSSCPHLRSLSALIKICDLGKDRQSKLGVCSENPALKCHLKEHTVLLKRYGHFGKVPTAAALLLHEQGGGSFKLLKKQIWKSSNCPSWRATRLIETLSASWRVSDKIAAMFLSAITNRDLSGKLACWADGVDSSQFIVIDSNVDLFLKAIGYEGALTYRARKEFLQAISAQIDLSELDPSLQSYNPRIVQQALYMFMSVSNRREASQDCGDSSKRVCESCGTELSLICPRFH